MYRLRLIYDYTTDWWYEVVNKGVKAMESAIKEYGEAENTVIKNQGQFENIRVEKKDLMGDASISPEISVAFPLSSDQKLSMLMQLIQLNNPMIESVIGHPENAHLITEALGWPDLYIPGEAQRFKALIAIKKLLKISPENMPTEGPNKEILPSIMPDQLIDDEESQIAVFKYFLSSEKGMQVLDTNPAGYANCRGYLEIMQKSYLDKQQNKTQQQMQQVQVGKEFKTLLNQKIVKNPG